MLLALNRVLGVHKNFGMLPVCSRTVLCLLPGNAFGHQPHSTAVGIHAHRLYMQHPSPLAQSSDSALAGLLSLLRHVVLQSCFSAQGTPNFSVHAAHGWIPRIVLHCGPAAGMAVVTSFTTVVARLV